MLPVSAWPPGPPGDSLSPFGLPRQIWVSQHPNGFVIPKGAWVVRTTSNRVIMFAPPVQHHNPPRSPGTGLLPGSIPANRPPQPRPPPCPPPSRKNLWTGPGQVTFTNGTAAVQMSLSQPTEPCPPAPPRPPRCPPPQPKQFMRYNDYVDAWRAWQRRTGNTDPPIRPLPGRRPPNWFGWRFDPRAPSATLVHPNSAGTVLADGQNVVIAGGGCATIIQAFSV